MISVCYDRAGHPVGSPQTRTGLPVNGVWILNRWGGTLPTNFAGSAVLVATQPVVAIVNVSHTGDGDTHASYTASNR